MSTILIPMIVYMPRPQGNGLEMAAKHHTHTQTHTHTLTHTHTHSHNTHTHTHTSVVPTALTEVGRSSHNGFSERLLSNDSGKTKITELCLRHTGL